MDKARTSEAGFTLVEMIVVLAIIGLIAAVAVPQVMKLLGSSKSKAAKVQLETVLNGLNYYNIDVGAYPTSEQGLDVLWQADAIKGWNGPYVRRQEQLIDPWGRPFIYRSPGEAGAFDLLTFGADGKEGGEGDDKDLFATK